MALLLVGGNWPQIVTRRPSSGSNRPAIDSGCAPQPLQKPQSHICAYGEVVVVRVGEYLG